MNREKRLRRSFFRLFYIYTAPINKEMEKEELKEDAMKLCGKIREIIKCLDQTHRNVNIANTAGSGASVFGGGELSFCHYIYNVIHRCVMCRSYDILQSAGIGNLFSRLTFYYLLFIIYYLLNAGHTKLSTEK